jgi:hypothetical protein
LLAASADCLSSGIDEKLIELLGKYEELYDMANKKGKPIRSVSGRKN